MERRENQTYVNEAEASGGSKGHGVRYVLAIGLLLVIAAMSAVWIIPALTG